MAMGGVSFALVFEMCVLELHSPVYLLKLP
jgi:hypothetical protein